MKLSEKLSALEESTAPAPAPARRPRRARPANEAVGRLRRHVLAELAQSTTTDLQRDVRTAIDRALAQEATQVSAVERRKLVQEVVQDMLGHGPLDPLLADPAVTEIMCNGYDELWVERSGRIEQTDHSFRDEAHYRSVIERIVSRVGRRLDEGSPMVDARLPDGSRVNAIIPPLAVHGPVLTIRKFAPDPYTAADLVRFGTMPIALVPVFEACVAGKLNVLISGGTGTGKTTLLNVLSSFIPDGERIITIEDAAELRLQQPHVVALEARPANAEGAGAVQIRDLVRNALRMRPDRIVVGESRGAEAFDMLQAMNTGHEGSLTTVHANSPRDALRRLETMVLMAGFDLPVRAIREQAASAIHLVVQLERQPGGRRVVTAVTEVQGLEGDTVLLQDVFAWRSARGRDGGVDGELVPTGLRPRFVERLAAAGVSLPEGLFVGRAAGARVAVAR
ncbi:MAG TPA: CpaF family protein [Acidimicrobiales bacterium]|jgi:pilus assembly protein CpaF|nr:CpaF family protein [Acidimicrobiales bacterium]